MGTFFKEDLPADAASTPSWMTVEVVKMQRKMNELIKKGEIKIISYEPEQQ